MNRHPEYTVEPHVLKWSASGYKCKYCERYSTQLESMSATFRDMWDERCREHQSMLAKRKIKGEKKEQQSKPPKPEQLTIFDL